MDSGAEDGQPNCGAAKGLGDVRTVCVLGAAHRDKLVLIPLVLLVIFIIIALLLQAIVAPLVLVLTIALSFGASFGLASLAWRYALGFKGTEAQLPLYIFIFLVALGVDYNIFLSARIREESRQLGIRDGTTRGLSVTGGVLVDTLLVRTILVPASILVIGERVWWPSRSTRRPAATRTTPAAAETT